MCRSVPGGDVPKYSPMPQCRFALSVQHADSYPQCVRKHTCFDGDATAAAAEGCGHLHAAATANHRCDSPHETLHACKVWHCIHLDWPSQSLAFGAS